MAIRTMGPSGQYETGLDAAGAALPELLAPAGGLDQMLAAIAAGADAIYAGLGGFNARVSAHGFTDNEFARGCAVAHAHGVRVYVTLNVFVFDDELSDAVALGAHALELGADALIVADAGLACALRAAIPGVEIHLSTQAGAHSEGAVRLAADELGVERVTTARELTVDEIAALCATGVPIEVFCHGAICIGYSGACEFSALRRGRSAMRGDCTQPCRLAYDLVDEAGQSVVAVEGDRLLCPRDYLGIEHLPELVAAGVASLKIEGRMKNPDYVFNVVRAWRRALDMLRDGAWDAADVAALERELGRSFNRGFTDAYLRGRSGTELMSFERAINQGVRVGRLVAVGHEEVTVELDAAVAAGDTLEIRFYPGADARPDVPKRWPQVPCPVSAAAGERVAVHCKRKVDVDCEVYLIRSAGVLEQTAAALERMHAEADAVAPAVRAVEVLPFEGVLTDSIAPVAEPAELAESAEQGALARMLFAWELMDADPCDELDLSDATVVLDEVCRGGDVERARSLMQRAGRVVCRNLGQVAMARELGVAFDVAAPVFCTNRATLAWMRGLGAGRVYVPAELLGNDKERIAELAAEPGVLGPIDADHPELMVSEHCLLTAEGVCATDATGQVHCRDCSRRRQTRYLVERDGMRLPVAVDACGRTRIFLS
ncbi:U32 family peptidase [Collinsella sp. AM23-17]|uniref:U32 family peptidase n=1 Tax=Collinsella sp. AM23-17 TaxID=2292030 RepID=UPI0013141CB2|nr:U32 family peptidase [Collinsella sp. AM23-17]